MPVITISANFSIGMPIVRRMSAAFAEILNRPERLICMIVNNTTVIVEGSEAPAVAVELKAKCMFLDSHNLNGVITATSALIVRELGVPTHRVFVACQNVRPDAISNTGASTCTINEVRR